MVGELVNTEFYAEDFHLVWLDHMSEDSHSISEAMELARPSLIGLREESSAQRFERFVQVTIRPGSSIIGNHVRDVGFQSVFASSVVAFMRPGMESYSSSISDMVLQAGDILILNVGEYQSEA